MFAFTSFAQQQLATLNHNDSITVYYGASALQQAHGAAVAGDIITLSPGGFTSVDITKAVTIRGAGMFVDTAAGTSNTTIVGSIKINISNDSLHSLYMEGLYFSNYFYARKIYNATFVKCLFSNTIDKYENSSIMQNATFINCIIARFNSYLSCNNCQFINSVILNMYHTGQPTLVNCVAGISCDNGLNNATVQNSILYSTDYSTGVNAYTSRNSIGIYTGSATGDRKYFDFTGLINHHLYNYRGFASVFKNFRGSLGEGIDFELLDTVAANCLGSDGTQVGIYGGAMPFDPSVRNPLIRRCNVGSRSTADGKLAVDIEIVSE